MDLIDREHPTSDDKPPWFGMVFKQRVYSDAMLESLKRRYPQGANLRERKHMAAIEFLQQELRDMQASEAALVSERRDVASTPDVEVFDYKHQRSTSPSSSPTALCPLPAITNEYHNGKGFPNTKPLKQSSSVSSMMSGQEIVFSVADGPIVQRRKRKKMTATEKIAYKQMRRVGACDSCKRQKAKCTHVSGATNKFRNSQTADSIPRRDSRSVSGSRSLHYNATGECEHEIRAAELSQELPQEHNTSFKAISMPTPADIPESPQCDQAMQTAAPSDSSGYVPASASSGPCSVSLHPVFEPHRSTINPQLLTMDYPNHFGFTEVNRSFPPFSNQRIIPYSHLDLRNVPTSPWGQFQGYSADGTNPG